MKKIKVGIADDNKEFCNILIDYFKDKENIEIVFTTHDGIKTVEAIKEHNPEIKIIILTTSSVIPEDNCIICGRTGNYNSKNYKPGS